MNRRGFISLLAGGAGAALVPWRLEITRTIILPPADPLVPISGMRIRELSVPMEWIEGPIQVNADFAFILASRLRMLEAHYRQLTEFVDGRTGRSIVVPLKW